MLTGIKAFEARWQSLKSRYATSAADNRLLMRAMGRLVDNYATHEEVSEELPVSLQGLFDHLVDAYLNGCWIDTDEKPSCKAVSPALLAAQQMRQSRKVEPTTTSEAATYIVRDRTEIYASIPSSATLT